MRRPAAVSTAVLAVAVLLAAAVVPVAAVHGSGHFFTVQLAENGDATVVVEDRYDLSNETERATFESVANNSTRRQTHRQEVQTRLDRGAALAAETTGRDIQSGEATLEVTEANGTGVVRVTGSWTNVAAVNTKFNIIELRQPFQSGFEVNRTLVVAGPDEYVRVATRPAPSRALKSSAYWAPDDDLSGLFVRFEGPTTATLSPAGNGGGNGQGTPTASVAPITGAGLAALSRAVAFALVPVLLVVLGFRRVGR